jgi:folate-binding protein YgfZ
VLANLDHAAGFTVDHCRVKDLPARLGDIEVYVSTWFPLGDQQALMIETALDNAQKLSHVLGEQGAIRCDHGAFESLRIECSLPLFDIDFNEENFPQEIDRDRVAISFTKGCYLGQETIARIDALGHVNQKIAGVRFFSADLPPVGAELSKGGVKVGKITSAAFSPRLNTPLALALVRREANSPGARLESTAGECEVISLPVASEC